MLPEPEEGSLLLWGGRSDDGTNPARCGNQSPGLAFHDPKVFGLGHVGIATKVELQNFALGHPPARVRQYLVNPLVVEIYNLTHGFGVEVVADQDADLVSPKLPRGLPSAP